MIYQEMKLWKEKEEDKEDIKNLKKNMYGLLEQTFLININSCYITKRKAVCVCVWGGEGRQWQHENVI